MTRKKAKIHIPKAMPDEQSVPPDVLQRVGIEFHDPATCTCEECVELRLRKAQEEPKAA